MQKAKTNLDVILDLWPYEQLHDSHQVRLIQLYSFSPSLHLYISMIVPTGPAQVG